MRDVGSMDERLERAAGYLAVALKCSATGLAGDVARHWEGMSDKEELLNEPARTQRDD